MTTQLTPMPPVGRNYSENRQTSTLLTCRVPETWKPIIEADAEQCGMGLSEYIRTALREKHERIQAEHPTLD